MTATWTAHSGTRRELDVTVMLAGDSGVGKTEFATINAAHYPRPRPGMEKRVVSCVAPATIGLDMLRMDRDHEICPDGLSVDGTIDHSRCRSRHTTTRIKNHFWDTAGQERFHSIVASYFRRADIVLLMYDLTDAATFENLVNVWYPLVSQSSRSCRFFIIGTKSDRLTVNGGELTRATDVGRVAAFAKQIGALETFESNAIESGGWKAYATFSAVSRMIAEANIGIDALQDLRAAAAVVAPAREAPRGRRC